MTQERISVLATTVLIALAALVLGAVPAAAAGPAPNTVVLPQSAPAASPGSRLEATPSSTPIEFDVALELSDPAGAVALQRAVSDPRSASYRHYLTPAQWEKRFSPSKG